MTPFKYLHSDTVSGDCYNEPDKRGRHTRNGPQKCQQSKSAITLPSLPRPCRMAQRFASPTIWGSGGWCCSFILRMAPPFARKKPVPFGTPTSGLWTLGPKLLVSAAIHGQMRQKRPNFARSHVAGVSLVVKQDKPFDPGAIRLFGAVRQMPDPTRLGHLDQKPGLFRWRDLGRRGGWIQGVMWELRHSTPPVRRSMESELIFSRNS